MGLRVNNVPTLKANHRLLQTQKAIARSLERLSSGRRVNSPRDDAHAYVMGVGLTSQIRGLAQANIGLNTGLGMIATAESAISTQLDIIQRMRELALQASNGTLADSDRLNLNQEVQALLSEYNRITDYTDFNGTKLLDGTFSTINIMAGANKNNTIGMTIGSTKASAVFTSTSTSGGDSQTIGTGTFQTRITSDSGANPYGLQAIDLNGDSILDLVTTNYLGSTASIMLGNGNGTFQTRTTIVSGTNPINVTTGDLNGDGTLDLIVTDFGSSTASIYIGNGNGTFQTRTTIGTGSSPYANIAIDINGDGKLDILTTDGAAATVSIFLGNGNGTFQTRTTIETGTNPYSFTIGDVNGDSKLDVISGDNFSGTASIMLGNGNGTFQVRTTVALGTAPRSILAGDVNGDGRLDLIDADSSASTASILLGNGNGTFQTRTTVSTGSAPFSTALGDFNGDGRVDLVIADAGGSTASIMLGNGNGTFQTRTTIAAGSAPRSVVAVDVNGDGVLDIITGDYTSGTVSVSIGNSTTTENALTTTISAATINISTQSNAEAMLQVFDDAMATLGATRANLAAIHSRLNVAIASNLILSENLDEARSLVLDTDYAAEVADLVRNQILQDAQIAVLTQANLTQRLVLKLLQ